MLHLLAGSCVFLPLPFGLISDGDLWAIFVHNAAARGVHSIELTWVKGHATEADINEGLSTVALQRCNGASDTNATLGLTQHGNMLPDVATFFVSRQRQHTKFMHRIVGSNVQVFKAFQSARK